ncbi:MAG: 4Fe-4S dicluster domain-containing protein [Acidobacteria bacterium]|nr:4Fe-4S dicluster domain-containing protein [Acidobacteriota bacterium]MCA1609775.1 4Fe-4S dicluster domain-containing protein [Acidobacteriota bacterium]
MPGTEDGAVHGPRTLIDDCVHCGFCLPACPTYNSWSEEMDSPRGRIDLMRGLAEGTLAFTDTVVAHFDRCLGCMGCVTACPSGVRYDVLIEETRAAIEKEYRRPILDRLYRGFLFLLFPYPDRLKVVRRLLGLYASSGLRRVVRASGLLEILPRRLAQLETLMPPVTGGAATSDVPGLTEAVPPARARVGLVSGCVQSVFFPEVNHATVRALSAEGCEVAVPPGQGCCGALSMHAGRDGEALAFARALIPQFEGQRLDAVIVNAAGCGSHLKDYGRLFAADPVWAERAAEFSARVRDVSEYLAAVAPAAPRHPIPLRVAYHDACHLAHAQRVREPPRLLLRGIPGLEILEVPDGDQCCGSAGIYNLTEPASAEEIGGRKADNVVATGADLLVSANPGCTLQIQKILRQRGIDLPAAHPIEILDASLAGAGFPPR